MCACSHRSDPLFHRSSHSVNRLLKMGTAMLLTAPCFTLVTTRLQAKSQRLRATLPPPFDGRQSIPHPCYRSYVPAEFDRSPLSGTSSFSLEITERCRRSGSKPCCVPASRPHFLPSSLCSWPKGRRLRRSMPLQTPLPVRPPRLHRQRLPPQVRPPPPRSTALTSKSPDPPPPSTTPSPPATTTPSASSRPSFPTPPPPSTASSGAPKSSPPLSIAAIATRRPITSGVSPFTPTASALPGT